MIPILMYHRIDNISPDQDLYPGMTMSPIRFEAQMRFLVEHNFNCISLTEVLRCHRGEMPNPQRPIAITFDDGYRDNYENAWPVLKKYGFTATIFLVANQIGKTNNWDRIGGQSAPALMSIDNILEMKKSGVEFGSHTLTHASLTDLSDEEARRQISESRQVLEAHLDGPVPFFSYPYDRLNGTIQKMVAESGYLGACGTSSLAHGPYNMWRVECLGFDSMALFRMKAAGLYNRWMWFRDRTTVGKIAHRIKVRSRNNPERAGS
ncbi:MAG: polysaccharide deacetylase family protein [Gammaproteobacteria bacterium]|nr:polysaccharide deacetylase family protein [Gammaproteobacteria bacterium]